LKDGLANLQRLRNGTVKPLGYQSYNSYQVSDYGMTSEEMQTLMLQINRELRPLYRELHTWARYELAKKYNKQVPDQLPADWLSNRWGQDWSELVSVEGMDVNSALKNKSAEWIVRQGEEFYVSLGFPRLPQSFWDKSSLYPLPKDAKYKKNNHASAWHLDLENDVRSLMSVEPNAEWFETSNHELGHIYYYLSYTNKDVPPLLREGANRAYHEAIGSLMGLAAMQKPFLENRGIVSKDVKVDEMQILMREALSSVVFVPWSAGTMPQFEYELYEKNLPKDRFNKRWWELVKQYQGIVPPTTRGEQFCDACTKTHINDDAAQYYDYALSYVLLFQMHDHIANKILKQNPRATDYYGNRQVGDFLREIMSPGASRDWRVVLKEKTGEDLSAKAMLRYFEPLTAYLKKQNAGRKYTLPDLPTS
jgi:peptidyl-dipeptidase A